MYILYTCIYIYIYIYIKTFLAPNVQSILIYWCISSFHNFIQLSPVWFLRTRIVYISQIIFGTKTRVDERYTDSGIL